MSALSSSDFLALVTEGYNVIPLHATLQLDRETPVSLYQRFGPERAIFLLESAALGETTGRYSFIGLDRRWRVSTDGPVTVTITGPGVYGESETGEGPVTCAAEPGERRGAGRPGVATVAEVVGTTRPGRGPQGAVDRLGQLDVVRALLREGVGRPHRARAVVGDHPDVAAALEPGDTEELAEPLDIRGRERRAFAAAVATLEVDEIPVQARLEPRRQPGREGEDPNRTPRHTLSFVRGSAASLPSPPALREVLLSAPPRPAPGPPI